LKTKRIHGGGSAETKSKKRKKSGVRRKRRVVIKGLAGREKKRVKNDEFGGKDPRTLRGAKTFPRQCGYWHFPGAATRQILPAEQRWAKKKNHFGWFLGTQNDGVTAPKARSGTLGGREMGLKKKQMKTRKKSPGWAPQKGNKIKDQKETLKLT